MGAKTGLRRWIAVGLAACLLLAAALTALLLTEGDGTAARRPQPYELPSDIGLVFTNADELVQTIRTALQERDRSITIRFSSQGEYMEDISPLVRALIDAALAHTGDPLQGDYLRCCYGGYTVSSSHEQQDDGSFAYKIKIVPVYYTTSDQEKQTDEAVAQVLRELGFTRTTTDEEKIAAIHDYVISHVAYDRVHKNHVNHHTRSTAYAALVLGTATCQGYCAAVYRLLLAAGVDCRVVTGTAVYEDGETELHAWNLVALGGVYYNLDATWDSLTQTRDYYLKADTSFTDHIRDSDYDTQAYRSFYPMAEQDYDDQE